MNIQEELKALSQSHNYNIIAGSKTWLQEQLCMRLGLSCVELAAGWDMVERLWVRIKEQGKKVDVSERVCYRPLRQDGLPFKELRDNSRIAILCPYGCLQVFFLGSTSCCLHTLEGTNSMLEKKKKKISFVEISAKIPWRVALKLKFLGKYQ